MSNLSRKRGDTYPDRYVLSSKETGAVLDITGYSFLLTVDPERYPVDDSNNLIQITGNIVDAVNGIVDFAPSLAQSDNLGDYFFDAQLTDTAGKIRTFDSGKYRFIQDITK